MSDTLVIHPKDVTTDCLSVIYEGRGWDVIRDYNTPRKKVIKQIKSHRRIVMLGHGSGGGLLAGGDTDWGFYRFMHYIVDHEMASLLKKKETYSIWCFSDQFFRAHNLKGFHTGMIISEVGEERAMLGYEPLTAEEMEENMKLFCGTCAKYFDLPPEEAREKILEEYVGSDPVTQFNRKNIIVL